MTKTVLGGKVAETSHAGRGIWILTMILPPAPFFFCFFFFLKGPHSQHMEVPRLGVELERGTPQPQQRQIQAKSAVYTQLTAMLDPLPTERGQELNPHPHAY